MFWFNENLPLIIYEDRGGVRVSSFLFFFLQKFPLGLIKCLSVCLSDWLNMWGLVNICLGFLHSLIFPIRAGWYDSILTKARIRSSRWLALNTLLLSNTQAIHIHQFTVNTVDYNHGICTTWTRWALQVICINHITTEQEGLYIHHTHYKGI